MSRRRGKATNVVIVGNNPRGYALARHIEASSDLDMSVLGFVNSWVDGAPDAGDERVLGDLEKIEFIVSRYPVDGVVFAVPRGMIEKIEPAVKLCETMGLRYWIAGDLFSHAVGQVAVERLDGWPLIRYEPTTYRPAARLLKRAFDILVSASLLIALVPLLLLIAAAVRMTSRGGVFFAQDRGGLNGRPFRMLKFRTMVEGAEAQRAELVARNEMQGPVFKMADDPRVTAVGRYLRRYYLDELPQLVNVLRGDMSIVGPRPLPTLEVAECEPSERRRLCVRPGLTCIWQVSKTRQRRTSFNEWTAMDLEYIDGWSVGLDLKLMLKTIPAVLRGTGQ